MPDNSMFPSWFTEEESQDDQTPVVQDSMFPTWFTEEEEETTTSKIKHATVDQMKEGVSFLQAEGDFVSNMNDFYKNSGIIFQEAAAGKDRFTMYDASTDTTSEEFDIPNALSTGGQTATWEGVNANVVNFFDRKKQEKPEFKAAKEKTENKVAEWLEKEDNLTNLLGPDADFSYIQPESRGGKGGVGEENDYEKVLRALKKQVGEFGPGFLGLTEGDFTATGEFAAMSEQSIEEIVKNAVTKKFEKDKNIKVEKAATNLAATISEENTTETKIDEANTAHKILTLTKDQKALHDGIQKLNTLEPGTKEYKDQQTINESLRNASTPWFQYGTEQLIDPITGASINPEAPEAATAITITEEDLNKTQDKIKLTYGDNVEQAFNVNGRKKWLSDKQGEQEYDVTINDPQAVAIFQKLGYEVKGANKNGYEMVVKKKHLSRYYDATVKSDGFTVALDLTGQGQVAPEDVETVGSETFGGLGPKVALSGLFNIKGKYQGFRPQDFKTDIGYFGLTEKVGEQEVRSSSLFHDLTTRTDEYEEGVDLSKAFKRSLKDYRDDRFNIIKEGKVLTKMHLLNIDPASTKS